MRRDRDELLAQLERVPHRALLLRDVPRDGRRAHDATLAVVDARDLHRHRDPRSILPDALGVVIVDALPAAKLLHDLGKLVGAVGWDDECDRAADDLTRRVSVEPLRALVPA